MDIIPYGKAALLVNFEQRIDPAINGQVHALDTALREARLPGLRFSTPAYCSLMVGFDPALISFQSLKVQLADWLVEIAGKTSPAGRHWRLPVCFADSFAWDQEEVLAHTGLANWQELIRLFTKRPLRVYMLGFLPGFPYLGALPEELTCPRKANPRPKVAAQSVSIAGRQAGIYPGDSPGGWQVVGRTPIPLFSSEEIVPFLFAAGDEVSFYEVGIGQYEELEGLFQAGEAKWKDFRI